MTRYCGKVGYAEAGELVDGIWEEGTVVERTYYGNVQKNVSNFQNDSKVLPDIQINNSISIMADAYAYQHFENIRYIEWEGRKFEVTSVDVQRPRLIVSLGGLYHGPTN